MQPSSSDGNNEPRKETLMLEELLLTLRANPAFQRELEKRLYGAPLTNNTRPHGTYYKKYYSDQLKPVLNAMMKTGEPMIWLYSKFPNVKERSLYLRISQSMLHLVRENDPDGTYTKFRQEVEVRQERNGVAIRFVKELKQAEGDLSLTAQPLLKPEETFKWKEQIDNFCEIAYADTPEEDRILHLKKLNLTPEQVQDLQVSLDSITSIVSMVTPTEVKLIKVDPLT